MFGRRKKIVNEDVLRQMDGREIKYVTRRTRTPDGEIKELILGKSGRIVVIEDEIRIMCGTEDVFKCDVADSEYSLMQSGDGLVVSGVNKLDGEEMSLYVFYKYYRK